MTMAESPRGIVVPGREHPVQPHVPHVDAQIVFSQTDTQATRHPLLESGFFRRSLDASPVLAEAVGPEWARNLLHPMVTESPWRFAHSLRVALIVETLARHSGFEDEMVLRSVRAGALHDIGFINNPRIPDGMVNNQEGRLKPDLEGWEGWEGVESHPVVSAYRIGEHDTQAAQIALGHHGFQDYRSYPVLIQDDGSAIYLGRRTLATADIAEAMQDPDRPHVEPESPAETRRRMIINLGEKDADLIDLAIEEAQRWRKILGSINSR